MILLQSPNGQEYALVGTASGYPGWTVLNPDIAPPGPDHVLSGNVFVFSQELQDARLAALAAATPTEVGLTLAGKQDTLESGVNVKTVGGVSVLGSGDIPLPGSNSLAGQVVLSVPNNSISAQSTLSAPGVTPTSVVMIGLAPHSDDDENSVDLIDLLSVSANPKTDQITVTVSFATPHAGPIRLNWSAF
jgi:hypothetical protein